MMSVANKPTMLNVVMLNAVILSVVMLSVVVPGPALYRIWSTCKLQL
jgi:hypothetical protein